MSLDEAQVDLEREDGVRLPGLQITPDFEPAEKCNGAGVLVVAGEWGLGPEELARFVRPLGEFGYFVVATDLVRGRRAETVEDARQRAAGLDHTIAIDDIEAGILTLKQLASGRIGVIGLDIAATIALEAATVLPHIDAVVHIAGSSPASNARLTRLRAQILVHRAERGVAMTELDYKALRVGMKRSKAQLLDHTYPTANDRFIMQPVDDDERDHSTIAWDRTRDFLSTALI